MANSENICVETAIEVRLTKYLGSGFSSVLYVYLTCFLLVLLLTLIKKADLMTFVTSAVHLSSLSVSIYMLAQLGQADAFEWYGILMTVGISIDFVYLCYLFKLWAPHVFLFNMMKVDKDDSRRRSILMNNL